MKRSYEEGLEDAAKVCNETGWRYKRVAERIRALKTNAALIGLKASALPPIAADEGRPVKPHRSSQESHVQEFGELYGRAIDAAADKYLQDTASPVSDSPTPAAAPLGERVMKALLEVHDEVAAEGATPRKATALCDLMREHAEYMATYSAHFVGSTEAIARYLRKGADYIEQLERDLAASERNRSEEVTALEHELRVWKEAQPSSITVFVGGASKEEQEAHKKVVDESRAALSAPSATRQIDPAMLQWMKDQAATWRTLKLPHAADMMQEAISALTERGK